jgi:hypothetical protein
MVYIGQNTWINNNAWSTDNGQSWDSIPTNPLFVTSPIFTDTLGHAMYTGCGGIDLDTLLYYTTNYGHSWNNVNAPFLIIQSGLIIGDVWYVLGYERDSSTISLFRSTISSLSVSQTNQSPQFHILTNPATHFLQLSLEDTPDDIRIVDFLGRTVARYSTLGGEFSADVSGLPEGLYWVVARSGAKAFIHLSE